MFHNTTSHHNRELFLVSTLTILSAAAVFFYFLLIGGMWLLAFLGTAAVVALVGVLHYLVWGQTYSRIHYRQRPLTSRWEQLPPALRERLRNRALFPREDGEDFWDTQNWSNN